MELAIIYWEIIGRIYPALLIFFLVFVFLKPNSQFRLMLYILLFILIRDVMTPLGLWNIGIHDGVLWIRFIDHSLFLISFGIFSFMGVLALKFFDKKNSHHLVWFKGNITVGIISGILLSFIVVVPMIYLYRDINVINRGGPVATSLLPAIFVFAMLGNLLEECLFRGYVLGELLRYHKPLVAGLGSGIIFALCHIFLAITVTDTGIALLFFVLWEGMIAGVTGLKFGIVPATLVHGGAIFILCSGLI